MWRRASLGLLAPDGFTPEYVADPANSLCSRCKPGDRLYVRETWAAGPGYNEGENHANAGSPVSAGRWAFSALWNSTGGDWDANPWVWVVKFRRIQL